MVVTRFDLASRTATATSVSAAGSARARRAQKLWKPIVIARPDNHPYHCLCTQVQMGLSEICPANILGQFLHQSSH